jgi:hypothetical protein
MSSDSNSPLSTRRGGADPVDIHSGAVNLEFSGRGDYPNTLEPSPPIEAGSAKPPRGPEREPHGFGRTVRPCRPNEPGTATFSPTLSRPTRRSSFSTSERGECGEFVGE